MLLNGSPPRFIDSKPVNRPNMPDFRNERNQLAMLPLKLLSDRIRTSALLRLVLRVSHALARVHNCPSTLFLGGVTMTEDHRVEQIDSGMRRDRADAFCFEGRSDNRVKTGESPSNNSQAVLSCYYCLGLRFAGVASGSGVVFYLPHGVRTLERVCIARIRLLSFFTVKFFRCPHILLRAFLALSWRSTTGCG